MVSVSSEVVYIIQDGVENTVRVYVETRTTPQHEIKRRNSEHNNDKDNNLPNNVEKQLWIITKISNTPLTTSYASLDTDENSLYCTFVCV